jgi:hypothetical protein
MVWEGKSMETNYSTFKKWFPQDRLRLRPTGYMYH